MDAYLGTAPSPEDILIAREEDEWQGDTPGAWEIAKLVLTEKEYTTLDMVINEGCTFSDVARITGSTRQTIHQRYTRALTKLRKICQSSQTPL